MSIFVDNIINPNHYSQCIVFNVLLLLLPISIDVI